MFPVLVVLFPLKHILRTKREVDYICILDFKPLVAEFSRQRREVVLSSIPHIQVCFQLPQDNKKLIQEHKLSRTIARKQISETALPVPNDVTFLPASTVEMREFFRNHHSRPFYLSPSADAEPLFLDDAEHRLDPLF